MSVATLAPPAAPLPPRAFPNVWLVPIGAAILAALLGAKWFQA